LEVSRSRVAAQRLPRDHLAVAGAVVLVFYRVNASRGRAGGEQQRRQAGESERFFPVSRAHRHLLPLRLVLLAVSWRTLDLQRKGGNGFEGVTARRLLLYKRRALGGVVFVLKNLRGANVFAMALD